MQTKKLFEFFSIDTRTFRVFGKVIAQSTSVLIAGQSVFPVIASIVCSLPGEIFVADATWMR
jgi:hypothetical protein